MIKILEEIKNGHAHKFEREDEMLGKRECTIMVDDPGWDCTDFAHPAYFRGQDHAVDAVCKQLLKLTKDDSYGKYGVSNNSDLQKIREWIISTRDKLKRATFDNVGLQIRLGEALMEIERLKSSPMFKAKPTPQWYQKALRDEMGEHEFVVGGVPTENQKERTLTKENEDHPLHCPCRSCEPY